MTTGTAETPAPSTQRPPTPQLNKALSQLQGKLPKITKGETAEIDGKDGKKGFKYSYADLADVTQAVGPLLAEFGLAFHAAPTRDPADRREMILIWELLHESGEEKTGEWYLGPANTPPQTLGSRITYARRYCLGAATGIVAEDDDDGQRGQQQQRSAGDAWEGSTRERPQRNGTRDDGPKVDQVAQALAKLALQIAANPDKTLDDFSEQVEKRAAGKEKLDAPVANPFGDGLVKLRDVLREARSRMQGGKPDGERTEGPAADPGVGEQAEAIAEAAEASADADQSDPESAFVLAYMARVADATDEELTGMRPEIGAAVKDKTITPKVAGELAASVSARRRELAELVTS
jgi:hypothetical protein